MSLLRSPLKLHNGDLYIAMVVLPVVFTINVLHFTVCANTHGLS